MIAKSRCQEKKIRIVAISRCHGKELMRSRVYRQIEVSICKI